MQLRVTTGYVQGGPDWKAHPLLEPPGVLAASPNCAFQGWEAEVGGETCPSSEGALATSLRNRNIFRTEPAFSERRESCPFMILLNPGPLD